MKSRNIKQLLFGKEQPLVQVGIVEGSELSNDEQGMIQGIRHLSTRTVKDIMVPRIDAAFLPLNHPPDKVIQDVVDGGYSRIPVYKETIDNVVGILYVKDILFSISKKNPIQLAGIIRKPFFVPDSKRLDSLLAEMKRRRIHIAVVVDEYGGVSGIVCLEDIIEEIVGEIRDEFDDEQENILQIEENIYLCDARTPIEDINHNLHLRLPHSDFDTLGGFVFDLFGRIPVRYETQHSHGVDFVIQEMNGHRIESVKIVQPIPQSNES